MSDEEIRAFNEAEQRIIDSCTKTITLYKKEYVEKLEKENEKLNHYKLLYQKVKNRNDKAIEYIKEQGCYEEDTKVFCDDLNYYAIPKLLEILKGNEE